MRKMIGCAYLTQLFAQSYYKYVIKQLIARLNHALWQIFANLVHLWVQ